jgi:hypothetical protein
MGLTWALAQKIRWIERRPLRFKMLPKRNRVFCHFFLVILRPEIQSKTYAVCIYMFHTVHLQKKWWIKKHPVHENPFSTKTTPKKHNGLV